jgi:hypothetical protein
MEDFYALLGLPYASTQVEIDAALAAARNEVFDLPPDQRARRVELLGNAFAALGEPDSRRGYRAQMRKDLGGDPGREETRGVAANAIEMPEAAIAELWSSVRPLRTYAEAVYQELRAIVTPSEAVESGPRVDGAIAEVWDQVRAATAWVAGLSAGAARMETLPRPELGASELPPDFSRAGEVSGAQQDGVETAVTAYTRLAGEIREAIHAVGEQYPWASFFDERDEWLLGWSESEVATRLRGLTGPFEERQQEFDRLRDALEARREVAELVDQVDARLNHEAPVWADGTAVESARENHERAIRELGALLDNVTEERRPLLEESLAGVLLHARDSLQTLEAASAEYRSWQGSLLEAARSLDQAVRRQLPTALTVKARGATVLANTVRMGETLDVAVDVADLDSAQRLEFLVEGVARQLDAELGAQQLEHVGELLAQFVSGRLEQERLRDDLRSAREEAAAASAEPAEGVEPQRATRRGSADRHARLRGALGAQAAAAEGLADSVTAEGTLVGHAWGLGLAANPTITQEGEFAAAREVLAATEDIPRDVIALGAARQAEGYATDAERARERAQALEGPKRSFRSW